MIYLDYSATTPVDDEVLEVYNKVSKNYIGNTNSLHRLGVESRKLMEESATQIANILKIKKEEIIFTSGATESNNLAILGVLGKYQNRGKHIITTKLEHSSILEVINYLKRNGYILDYVNINKDGTVDLEHLKSLLTKDTILVSINYVNSEVGIVQPIDEIGKIIKNYPQTIFHVDATQGLGKINLELEHVDLCSMSGHKIYAPKGIGCLIKKDHIELEPLIHGGKSQTIYRSGTPALPLIVSFAKAIKKAYINIDEKYEYIKKINEKIKSEIKKIENIEINSNELAIPHILNISVIGLKPETVLQDLSNKDIFISTKSACSSELTRSLALHAMGKEESISTTSIRVSLSHLTTEIEVETFIKEFKKTIQALNLKKGQ